MQNLASLQHDLPAAAGRLDRIPRHGTEECAGVRWISLDWQGTGGFQQDPAVFLSCLAGEPRDDFPGQFMQIQGNQTGLRGTGEQH